MAGDPHAGCRFLKGPGSRPTRTPRWLAASAPPAWWLWAGPAPRARQHRATEPAGTERQPVACALDRWLVRRSAARVLRPDGAAAHAAVAARSRLLAGCGLVGLKPSRGRSPRRSARSGWAASSMASFADGAQHGRPARLHRRVRARRSLRRAAPSRSFAEGGRRGPRAAAGRVPRPPAPAGCRRGCRLCCCVLLGRAAGVLRPRGRRGHPGALEDPVHPALHHHRRRDGRRRRTNGARRRLRVGPDDLEGDNHAFPAIGDAVPRRPTSRRSTGSTSGPAGCSTGGCRTVTTSSSSTLAVPAPRSATCPIPSSAVSGWWKCCSTRRSSTSRASRR